MNEIENPKVLEMAEEAAMRMPAQMADHTLFGTGRQTLIGREEIMKAAETLQRYKNAKASLERRIIEDEEFWKLRHWDYLRRKKDKSGDAMQPVSAWLFNSLINKHADIMDNYPEVHCLPREESDQQDATALSSIIPVVLSRNEFEKTYSDAAWYKIKHGTSCFGAFWNKDLENGLGDIDIRDIDLLNIFWEPGITDIQDSKNLFIVDLVDDDTLKELYPDKKIRGTSRVIEVADYIYDDTVDTGNKSVVVDWYYKVRDITGKTILHYVKFVGDTILFASENEEEYQNGWYGHGMYPVVFDVLYPEAGTPYGYGIISVAKDPQLYIDKLDACILKHSLMKATPRWFAKKDVGINIEDYLDWNNPVVYVQGDVNDERLKPIEIPNLDNLIVSVKQMKIDELKETSSNRDFSQGSTAGGVTSGAAIATLQEAGNKTSRDMIGASYRAYVKMVHLVIELMRQFYDEERSFRITGKKGYGYEFINYSNETIRDTKVGEIDGEPLFRRPVFDIDVHAQKQSPYNTQAQNETAVNLYNMGMFNPQMAQMALPALEMMRFEGREKVLEYVAKGQTLMKDMSELQKQMQEMTSYIQFLKTGGGGQPPAVPGAPVQAANENAQDLRQTGYMDKLREKAMPVTD